MGLHRESTPTSRISSPGLGALNLEGHGGIGMRARKPGKLNAVRACDPFKDRISFHFKDLKTPTIEYHASFCHKLKPEKHRIDITIRPGSKSLYRDEAWTVFREYATFDDIFEGLRTPDIHNVKASSGIPDLGDLKKWTDKKFLNELSRHPEWLALSDESVRGLILLLKTAQIANSKKGGRGERKSSRLSHSSPSKRFKAIPTES